MSVFDPRTLSVVTGGSWMRKPMAPVEGDLSPLVPSLSTDTRTIKAGEGFIALRGERFDGHEFLDSAAAAGAALLIVDRPDAVPPALLKATTGPAILRVKDTRRALGRLAGAHRDALEGTRVVAVVGSNGKTTTVRLIQSVLATRLRGSASPKSFNNDIGVPLTILAARKGDQYLVCEVGSNHPGETQSLGRIVRPDVVVVTSVGRDHLEFFDSLEAVVREHASIFPDLTPGGLAIVPANEPRLADFLKPVPNVITFGRDESADLRLTRVKHVDSGGGTGGQAASGAQYASVGLRFTVNDRLTFDLPLLGEHNALNALAAVAVARRFGLDDRSIAHGLASATPPDMRMNRRNVRGVDLLVDCYNSNPDSLAAGLHAFSSLFPDGGRRVLILGDMLEMGRHADAVHAEAIALVPRLCPSRLVVLVGEAFAVAAGRARESLSEMNLHVVAAIDDAVAARIASMLRPGDAAFLKGSRGVRLERIIQALEKTPSACRSSSEHSRAS